MLTKDVHVENEMTIKQLFQLVLKPNTNIRCEKRALMVHFIRPQTKH
jgi:hypothetical protein